MLKFIARLIEALKQQRNPTLLPHVSRMTLYGRPPMINLEINSWTKIAGFTKVSISMVITTVKKRKIFVGAMGCNNQRCG
ncbi:hypothetical protein PIB30_102800, partial [Stylosanthes scabra]|nr:hypothetical protein [Stylosanthes scabra]